MVDSPHHPEMDVVFALGEAGVIDPEDTIKKKKTSKKSEPKEEVTETSDISAETLDSEPKEEVTETSDISAETLDSESHDLK
jgi:DNA repair protein RadA